MKSSTKHKIRQAETSTEGASLAIQGSGPPNRHGMPQLPPKQKVVTKWPVLNLGIQPEIAKKDWSLRVFGEVERPLELDWEAFIALPQVTQESDFHCVTTWSRLDNR